MNMNELTHENLNENVKKLPGTLPSTNGLLDDLIGKHVVVRADMSGCWLGTLDRYEGDDVRLTNARRLWYWAGASSLSELAKFGVARPEQCKFPCHVDVVIVKDVCEILEASERAVESIFAVPEWKQRED